MCVIVLFSSHTGGGAKDQERRSGPTKREHTVIVRLQKNSAGEIRNNGK